MKCPDLLTVGEAFEDLVFFDLPALPEPGEEIKTDRFIRTTGGGAVITAVAAARCGLQCKVVSGLGPLAARLLIKEAVPYRNLRGDAESHAVTVALSTPANRSFVTFNGVNNLLEYRLFEVIREEEARHIHFAFYPSDCGKWLEVLEHFRARGVTSSWDFGWNKALLDDPHFHGLLSELDYLFLNEEELALYSEHGSQNIVIKLGSRGCRWIGPERDLLSPAVELENAPVDTTGAGDAFNGGFLYGLLTGKPPEEILLLANTLGAFSTRAPGGIEGLPPAGEVG
jgi:sugar/nucleoside kinase (ribokinase family)